MIDQEIGLKLTIIKHLEATRKKTPPLKNLKPFPAPYSINLAFQNHSKQQFWTHKSLTLWPEIWQLDETVVSTVKIMVV